MNVLCSELNAESKYVIGIMRYYQKGALLHFAPLSVNAELVTWQFSRTLVVVVSASVYYMYHAFILLLFNSVISDRH